MNKSEVEQIAEAAADAAQEFIDNLEGVLDSDELWDFVYNSALAAQTKP